MQHYCKSSVETPTMGFWQLIFNILCEDVLSQLWACQAVGANYHQCSNIFIIQDKGTGVICRVITPKDKERYPSPLTKQIAQGLELYIGLSHLKTRKGIQAPFRKKYEEKNLMRFVETNIRWGIIYFVFTSPQNSSIIAVKPWF